MSIDLTAYPDAYDVALLLKSAKLWPGDSDATGQAFALQQAEVAALGARGEWERRTGWLPFLALASPSTRYYDGTDVYGGLDLQGGIVSEPSVLVNDSTRTLDEDYFANPNNALTQGAPYTHLSFVQPLYAISVMPGRIAVTARWGYCTELPADVWAAIQKYAGVLTLMSIENQQSVASISQDGFSKGYDIVGTITQKDLLTTWGKDWDKAVRRYIRVVA